MCRGGAHCCMNAPGGLCRASSTYMYGAGRSTRLACVAPDFSLAVPWVLCARWPARRPLASFARLARCRVGARERTKRAATHAASSRGLTARIARMRAAAVPNAAASPATPPAQPCNSIQRARLCHVAPLNAANARVMAPPRARHGGRAKTLAAKSLETPRAPSHSKWRLPTCLTNPEGSAPHQRERCPWRARCGTARRPAVCKSVAPPFGAISEGMNGC